jgi:hypothetical protein
MFRLQPVPTIACCKLHCNNYSSRHLNCRYKISLAIWSDIMKLHLQLRTKNSNCIWLSMVNSICFFSFWRKSSGSKKNGAVQPSFWGQSTHKSVARTAVDKNHWLGLSIHLCAVCRKRFGLRHGFKLQMLFSNCKCNRKSGIWIAGTKRGL